MGHRDPGPDTDTNTVDQDLPRSAKALCRPRDQRCGKLRRLPGFEVRARGVTLREFGQAWELSLLAFVQ